MTIPDPTEQPTMTVEQTGEALGISRSTAYDGVASGEIPSIRVGRRLLVPTAAVRRMLLLDHPGTGAPAARAAQMGPPHVRRQHSAEE